MKKIFTLLLVLISLMGFAQQASDYFPPQLGYKWYFKNVPLDSLNRKVDSLTTYSIDSLAFEQLFQGVTAKFILSKTGGKNNINQIPYLDTSYLNFSGTTANEFMKVPLDDSLIAILDSLGIGNLVQTLKSLEKWYPIYKFASTPGWPYLVFKFDTTLTINSVPLPLSFSLTGTRLSDQSLTTEIGTFTCKKFIHQFVVGFGIYPLVIPFITLKDTFYIAPGKWVVKSVVPSTSVDLDTFGIGTVWIPGNITEVTNPFSSIKNKSSVLDYYLQQNYPNPFNPVTTISYTIAKSENVKLIIYNALGQAITTPIDEYKEAGSYTINISAEGINSGVYFYRIESGNFSQVKKMIILK